MPKVSLSAGWENDVCVESVPIFFGNSSPAGLGSMELLNCLQVMLLNQHNTTFIINFEY